MLWHTLNFSQWHIDCGCAVVSINGMLRNIGVLLLLLLLLLVISVLLHKSVRSDFPDPKVQNYQNYETLVKCYSKCHIACTKQ